MVTRSFHNLTSRYNGYYWAGESFKEGVEKIEMAHKDDYSRIIPVFIYTKKTKDSKPTNPDMERTILKSSTVIQRHTIVDKNGKEIVGAVKWIDDNYMMVGKGQFYKGDYLSALETFEYVSKTYKNTTNQYEALLWMIRCNNELGAYGLAKEIVDDLKGDKDFPKKLSADHAAVVGDYYLKKEEYHNAAKELTKAAAYTKKKKERARYTFILAQLYQKEGNAKKASLYYHLVVKMTPDYDMSFNAKINIAKLYSSEFGDSKKIKKDFKRMLRDEKNAEYKDQIYYALAEIEKNEGHVPAAIDFLNKSIKVNTSNKTQRALSFLELGDIYFDVPNYKKAQINYDSTIVFLDKNYPNYEQIANKQRSLKELVKNLDIIELEDSVQALAKLTEKERIKIIHSIITKVEQEEVRLEEEMQNKKNAMFDGGDGGSGTGDNTSQGGLWYFYNTSTMSIGLAEFNKRWGDRKLEDNWRRSLKELVLNQTDNNTAVSDTSNKKKNTGIAENKTVEYYLKNIPLTQDSLKKSNERIMAAYYEAGNIYKEQILSNAKAAETFEELLKRFPENPNQIACYYQLYRLYTTMQNKEKATYNKNIILNKYPDSEYAKLIKMPDYSRLSKASRNKIIEVYTETYQAYKDGKYSEVLSRCEMVDTLYYKNFLMPKFDYLRALAIGRTQDVKTFQSALTQITIKYPKDDVTPKAQDIIDYIKKNDGLDTIKKSTLLQPKTSKYNFDKDAHCMWVTIFTGKTESNKFKTKLHDLNTSFFASDSLAIKDTVWGDLSSLLEVKNFKDKDKGMGYYNFVKEKKNIFEKLDSNSYYTFIISPENYALLNKEKDVKEYYTFFKENYLK